VTSQIASLYINLIRVNIFEKIIVPVGVCYFCEIDGFYACTINFTDEKLQFLLLFMEDNFNVKFMSTFL
jgi:hypothetical protein